MHHNNAISSNNNNNNDESSLDRPSLDARDEERAGLLSSSPPSTLRSKLQILLHTNFYLKIFLVNLKQISKNKGRFVLGFLSCFLVVIVIALLMTLLVKAPVVFLTLAEAETGEVDLVLYVSDEGVQNTMFNYTLIHQLTQDTKAYQYSSPRFDHYVNVFPTRVCPSELDPFNPRWKYEGLHKDTSPSSCIYSNCFDEVCDMPQAFQGTFFLIDSELEDKMDLGREWIANKHGAIEKGKVIITEELSKLANVTEGDIVYLKFDAGLLLGNLWRMTITETTKAILQSYDAKTYKRMLKINIDAVFLPVTVQKVVTGNQGKFSSYETEVILMEYKHFLPYLVTQLNTFIPAEAQQTLSNKTLYEYAEYVVFNLPPNRADPYIDSDYDSIRTHVVQWASQVAYTVGFNQINTDLPVVGSLYQTRYLSLFLGLVLYVVIFILLLLATLLVYSLLTIDVQTRSFEMAVLRSMGISNSRLVYVLLMYAFLYAIPSWVIGLIVAQLASFGVINAFNNISSIKLSSLLTGTSILTATFIVFLVPLFASIFPIWEVLGQSVQDALDRNRSKTKAVEISIDRAESEGGRISGPYLIIGTAFSAFGVSIYFLFPYSLLSGRLSILLYILVFLLIGMILGLVILSLNLDHMLSRILIPIFFFWDKASTRRVLVKNMIAHRVRNQKTTIMYSLSLGFIIFLSVSYDLQVESFMYAQQKASGSFLRIYSAGLVPGSVVHNRIDLVADLEAVARSNPNVIDTAWASIPLSNALPVATDIELTNVGHAFTTTSTIYAATPNFYDVTFPQFQTFYDEGGNVISGHNLMDELYSQEGSAGLIFGSYQAQQLGVFKNNDHVLMSYHNGASTQLKRMIPMGTGDSSPYFYFSKFPLRETDALVSFTTYMRLSNGAITSFEDIPLGAFFLKLKDGITVNQVNELKSNLLSVIISQQSYFLRIWDYNQSTQRAELGKSIMLYVFSFAIAIAMAICFFSLMSSMYSNIHEQAKEIGVLRVLGSTTWWMYRVYIFEAFILVFSSSLMGVVIGTLVGYTMLLQRILWTQLPIPFTFPFQLVFVIFLLSIVFAFLSSWRPVRTLMRLPIVTLLKK